MAGNRKKKKPSNPARGFATTSVASKSKKEEDSSTADNSGQDKSANETPNTDRIEPNKSTTKQSVSQVPSQPVEIDSLSPEEYERQLEDAELQNLVDNYGQKAKRDSVRVVTKLQTERRLLSTQGEELNTFSWINPELLETIIDLIKADLRSSPYYDQGKGSSSKMLSEDELVIRLWTLQQTLLALGFTKEISKHALKNILSNNCNLQGISTPKDTIWGLDEAIDWLAIECPVEELPSQNQRPVISRNRVNKAAIFEGSHEGTGSISSSANVSDSEGAMKGNVHPTKHNPKETSNANAALENIDWPRQSDLELDPDELIPTYVSIKAQLFELRPELLDMKKSRKKLSKHLNRPQEDLQAEEKGTREDQLEVRRLQGRLASIEKDILFDSEAADVLWTEKRRSIAQAKKSRLLECHDSNDSEVAEQSLDEPLSVEEPAVDDTKVDDEPFLEGLFALSDDMNGNPQENSSLGEGSEASVIIIEDFGKMTGLNPRRVFEEACKSKDPSSKFEYKLIFKSNFCCRHLVQVTWSKDIDILNLLLLPRIDCSVHGRTVSVAMKEIATPNSAQSEAYVSVAALFLIFSTSSKDEKVYLRLPAIWRDQWDKFLAIKREQEDRNDKDTLRQLRSLISEAGSAVENQGTIPQKSTPKTTAQRTNNLREVSFVQTTPSLQLQELWAQKASTKSFQDMILVRSQLPIWNYNTEILNVLRDHQMIIVCGETGSGKSTQTPRFILEHELSNGRDCKIYCLQPRRISAISLAQRVGEELGEKPRDLGSSKSLVGYAIRLETRASQQTKLIYATNGILLKMLESSPDLDDITHIILDEIHERSIESDFLLIILRKLVSKRPDLRVILMSATVDAQRFSTYLEGASVVNVPGRTYPVEAKFLEDAIEITQYSPESGGSGKGNSSYIDDDDDDFPSSDANVESVDIQGYSSKTRRTLSSINEYRIDYDLVATLLESIATCDDLLSYSKAILIFLPGIAEIRRLHSLLAGHPLFSSGWYIYPMHSTISSEDQAKAFLVPPPQMRKIILATNIAETGITIPDVTCVIDTGKHKEMRFDERRQLSRLLETFISRANALQRRGRAGRVQPGLCFHLFTRTRFEKHLSQQQTPEILRLSLQDLVLRVKICKLGAIEDVLSQALDPPSAKNIRRAIDALIQVNALTSSEELTPLGVQLAKLPVDIFLGKSILLGSIFKCLDVALTIGAIISSKSPFSAPYGAKSQADASKLLFQRGNSDLLTAYNAYCAWKKVCNTAGSSEYQYCRKHFLSPQNLSNIEDIKMQLLVAVVDAGFVNISANDAASLKRCRAGSRKRHFFELPDGLDINSNNDTIVNSILAWSFYPQLLRREGQRRWKNIMNNRIVNLHPSSIVSRVETPPKWLSYYHIMQSTNKSYNAFEANAVDDFSIAIFSGDAQMKLYAGGVIIDGNRIRFSVKSWRVLLAIKYLRKHLEDLVNSSYKQPGWTFDSRQQQWFEIWQQIFAVRDRP